MKHERRYVCLMASPNFVFGATRAFSVLSHTTGLYITFKGASQRNVTFHKVENNQTIITVILPQMKTIPEEMTMLPYLGLIEEKFKPSMSLDLKKAVDK